MEIIPVGKTCLNQGIQLVGVICKAHPGQWFHVSANLFAIGDLSSELFMLRAQA